MSQAASSPFAEVRLLGPVELGRRDGSSAGVGSGMERTLLAALAVNAGLVVSTGDLIDGLWGSARRPRPAMPSRSTCRRCATGSASRPRRWRRGRRGTCSSWTPASSTPNGSSRSPPPAAPSWPATSRRWPRTPWRPPSPSGAGRPWPTSPATVSPAPRWPGSRRPAGRPRRPARRRAGRRPQRPRGRHGRGAGRRRAVPGNAGGAS